MTIEWQHPIRSPSPKPAAGALASRLADVSGLDIPEGHVLVLGLLHLRAGALDGLRAGSMDLLLRGGSIEESLRTIRALGDGAAQPVVPIQPLRGSAIGLSIEIPEAAARLMATLTGRERQVVGLIGTGRSNREIATELSVAVHTVKTHVHKILQKLGVRTRLEVAALVHGAGQVITQRPITRVA